MDGTMSGLGPWFVVVLILWACSVSGAPVELCSDHNKNLCARFPDLCSAGGGLCVVKGPCEYQCVCPPDGRVGRDCMSSANPQQGTVVDSLIIFPKDIFYDANHMAKSQDFVGAHLLTTIVPTTVTTVDTVATTRQEASSAQETATTPSKTTSAISALAQATSSGVLPSEPPVKGATTAPGTTGNSNATGKDVVDLRQNVPPSGRVLSPNESYMSSTKDPPSTSVPREQKEDQIVSAFETGTMSGPGLLPETADNRSQKVGQTEPPSIARYTSEQPPVATDKQRTASAAGDIRSTAAAPTRTSNSTTTEPPTNLNHHVVSPSVTTNSTSSDLKQTTEHVTPPFQTTTINSSQNVTERGIASSQVDLNFSSPSASPRTPNMQTATSMLTTFPPNLFTTTTTTAISHHLSSSSQDGLVSSIAPSNDSNNLSPPPAVEVFPIIFNVADTSSSQSDPGVNSPIHTVITRVFMPRERFEMSVRSRER